MIERLLLADRSMQTGGLVNDVRGSALDGMENFGQRIDLLFVPVR